MSEETDDNLVKVNDKNDIEKEEKGFIVIAIWKWNRQNYYIKIN